MVLIGAFIGRLDSSVMIAIGDSVCLGFDASNSVRDLFFSICGL